jgi:hypothetical protein
MPHATIGRLVHAPKAPLALAGPLSSELSTRCEPFLAMIDHERIWEMFEVNWG